MTDLHCDYCGQPASLVSGDVIYPHRRDLAHKQFWHCADCRAWVGCHQGTTNSLGRLANAELRKAKGEAHSFFDPLWRQKIKRQGVKKREARSKAYAWLSEQMGIPPEQTHIGMFDVEQCRRVVELCKPYYRSER